MNGYLQNSDWERRFAARNTARDELIQVIDGTMSLEDFMKQYKRLVLSYLNWFLVHRKLVADEATRSSASRGIWSEMMKALPDKIAQKWVKEGLSFRQILREAVHEGHFSWSHPERALAVVSRRLSWDEQEDSAWRRECRSELLLKARERLENYQRDNEARKMVYFTLFTIWDEDHHQSHRVMNERFAATMGGRGLSPENFRKTMGRTRAVHGRYLGEEVGGWLTSRGTITAEDYQEAFEELDLMDYVEGSPYCRALMGLDIYAKSGYVSETE